MMSAVVLIATMLDPAATVAQRNDACFALRGDRSPEAVEAMQRALHDKVVRTCAARDLREAVALDPLLASLTDDDADIRIAAARELGELRDPKALAPLGSAALDSNMMVAGAAIGALAAYQSPAALPYLLRAAEQATVAGINALEHAARSHEPAVLPLARRAIARADVAAQLIAITILGDLGDASDLPKLRELAALTDPVYSRGRGFGFMPPIDLGRAAQNAIAKIARTEPRP
jgi:HEAT repeat protein